MKAVARALWAVLGAFILLSFGCCTPGAVVSLASPDPGRADYALVGDIDGQSTVLFKLLTEHDGTPLSIEINSPGGSADEGILIHRMFLAAKTPTICVVKDWAASAAFVILQGCTRRIMHHGAKLLTHNPFAVITRPAALSPEEIQQFALDLKETADTMRDIVAVRMGMDPAAYAAKIRNGAWIMGPDEAIEVNAIDVVIEGASADTGP